MPNISPEDDLHAHAPIDDAGLSQPDGITPPDHISMEDIGYATHLLRNSIAIIQGCIGHPDDPTAQADLVSGKQRTIEFITFLLKRYGEDLRNMPEFRDFLELLLDEVQNDKFNNALKVYSLGIRAFQMRALDQPGRHLSQHDMEAAESEPSLRLTVVDHCKNPAGLYVGLSQVQRAKLGVEKGGTVELFDGKGKSLGVFTVGAGSVEYINMTDVFTANQVSTGAIVNVKKSVATPDKPQEFTLQVMHAVEKTIEPEKHRARTEKIAMRFPKLDSEMYITLPTSIAFQLGIKPEPGKTVAPISKCVIRDASGREVEIAIVPTGTNIGFTLDAAKELDIPKEFSEIKIIIDKGVLIIA